MDYGILESVSADMRKRLKSCADAQMGHFHSNFFRNLVFTGVKIQNSDIIHDYFLNYVALIKVKNLSKQS